MMYGVTKIIDSPKIEKLGFLASTRCTVYIINTLKINFIHRKIKHINIHAYSYIHSIHSINSFLETKIYS